MTASRMCLVAAFLLVAAAARAQSHDHVFVDAGVWFTSRVGAFLRGSW